MPEAGDVVLVNVRFTEGDRFKKRPALVLFVERGNVVVAAITSNTKMGGISLSVNEGAIKPSVIKLNYLFTMADHAIDRCLFTISSEKRIEVHDALVSRVHGLVA